MIPVAHVAGLPVEENLLTLAPVLPLLALAARGMLARVRRGFAMTASTDELPGPNGSLRRCQSDSTRPRP